MRHYHTAADHLVHSLAQASYPCDTLFFSYLLRDLEITDVQPILYTDSQGCMQVSKDPAKHWKLKHIDTWYHFVCDHMQEGDVAIKHVRTANNIADILTKPLQGLNTS